MEIETGEYVRTYFGEIGKCIDKSFESCVIDFNKEEHEEFFEEKFEEEIKNHSKNIIDLIEAGDFVNGYKVLEITNSIYESSKRILVYRNEKESYERWIYIQEYNGKIHTQDDIVSIVTKEQFEQVEYVVEE